MSQAGTVLDTEDMAVNKKHKVLDFLELTCKQEETYNKQNNVKQQCTCFCNTMKKIQE